MPVYHALGKTLVSHEELNARAYDVERFATQLASSPRDAAIEFSTGATTGVEVTSAASAMESFTPFESIGLHKPLAIEIRHIYTGRFPKGSFGGSKKDMLAATAVKSAATFGSAPRAVNYIKRSVESHANIRNPAASEDGTALVFYSPALTESAMLATFELVFDEFPQKVFEALGNAFSGAGKIPIFAAKNVFFLAAGVVTKMIGRVGESIFDGQLAFQATEELSFNRPGASIPQADYRLLTQSPLPQQTLEGCSLDPRGVLMDAAGAPYAGEEPYVTISLDGRSMPEYEGFMPHAASAAVLERFFNVKEGADQPLEPLLDAARIYSDLRFRREANEVRRRLELLATESPERPRLEERLHALSLNISNEELRI